MGQVDRFTNLQKFAIGWMLVVLASLSLFQAFAQGQDFCGPEYSEVTHIAHNCKEHVPSPPKEHVPPPPKEDANLSQINAFLTDLAKELAPNTPGPFNNDNVSGFVHLNSDRTGYYLELPYSHALADISIHRISERLSKALPRLAAFLERFKNVEIEIEVHTDGNRVAVPPAPNCRSFDNFALSKCRADIIQKFIAEKGFQYIAVVPRGDSEARCFKTRFDCSDTDSDRERQVRVVVKLKALT
jgi:hypothetical protein